MTKKVVFRLSTKPSIFKANEVIFIPMKDKKNNPYHNTDPSFLAGVFLFLITFALFSLMSNHDFSNYYNHLYITENNISKN
jgi:hypothetical protein